MSIVQYQCATSLDGFIARAGGDMSWLSTASGPPGDQSNDEPEMNPLVHAVGAVLSGRRTYDGDDPNADTDQEGAYDGQYDGPMIVLTHRLPETPVPGVTFVDDLQTAISAAKDAAGDKVVSVLGASIARQCLEMGQLDEVLVYLTPVLLGDGVRLFDRPGGPPVYLDVTESGSMFVRASVRVA
ncbi:dihydrofolate reductase family protein [Gordonia sp. HY002]|uniref:dihydrofolate reductase family protein n=1 Tax=Gordonia zhenghanii TaxID=2911516 RepID=UPI001EF08007|nr:dihydrofolate reductase family protein [Gordonia zhenghanii]MCF8569941.1 dihydrofolate reductase family protein [Gordonia zhenghanii]MCF8605102.1 dihydrofolate reductase family protein [Gordonia zhenghanii]